MKEVPRELLLVGRDVGCLKRGQNDWVVWRDITSAGGKLAARQGYHIASREKMAGW